MASTRYVTFSSSLLYPYFTVHVGWDELGDGGWTPLKPDDQVCRPSADLPLHLTDSTAKGAYSVISAASETHAPTLPSFKSRVL
jgi:hypothetical protein